MHRKLLTAAYTLLPGGAAAGSLLPAELTSLAQTVPSDGILEVVDGTIAHRHVEPAGMPAVDVRERALPRQVEAVADVLVIARMAGKLPGWAVAWLTVRGFWIGPSLLE